MNGKRQNGPLKDKLFTLYFFEKPFEKSLFFNNLLTVLSIKYSKQPSGGGQYTVPLYFVEGSYAYKTPWAPKRRDTIFAV
jgi:hypothetical protein